MKTEKATYSYINIYKCRDLIKDFDWGVPKRKNEFWAKAVELEQLYNQLYQLTGCCLFTADEYTLEWVTFYRASYDFKDYSVKELSNMLLANRTYLKNEVTSIYQMMERGEVNTEY